MTGGRVEWSAAERLLLPTGNDSSPRLGPGYLVYVASKGTTDSIWKQQGEDFKELWSAPDARVIGGPAIDRDGTRMAFSVAQQGSTVLYVANVDGTDVRPIHVSLALQGSPAWTPDGTAITTGAVVSGAPRLFNAPVDVGPPVPFGDEYAQDPVWSPSGTFVAFSGADIGTTFAVSAVTPDGRPYHLGHDLRLTRGARRLVFTREGRLVVLKGEINHKDLSLIDLATQDEQPLTDVPRQVDIRDFDISADGTEVVLERSQEDSDVVLFELQGR